MNLLIDTLTPIEIASFVQIDHRDTNVYILTTNLVKAEVHLKLEPIKKSHEILRQSLLQSLRDKISSMHSRTETRSSCDRGISVSNTYFLKCCASH